MQSLMLFVYKPFLSPLILFICLFLKIVCELNTALSLFFALLGKFDLLFARKVQLRAARHCFAGPCGGPGDRSWEGRRKAAPARLVYGVRPRTGLSGHPSHSAWIGYFAATQESEHV